MKKKPVKTKAAPKRDIYQRLEKDHRKVERLLDQLVAASEADNGNWKSLIDKIRDELIPHARAEEELFYNAIREKSKTGAKTVMHGYAEHAKAETELRTLQAAKAIDVNWTKLAKKLRADLLHHVSEEEGKIFTAARKVFSPEEAVSIGKAFEKMKPSIKKQSLGGTTIDMVSNLFMRGGSGKENKEKQKKAA